MALLPRPLLYEIHAAAVKAGLDRSTLLSSVDAGFAASLPEVSNRSAQLLSDLTELDRTERLADQSVPLATWLQNALAVAAPRVEAEVFRRGLEALGLAPPAPAAVPTIAGKVKILFLGANPSELTARALGTEVREIELALRRAEMGDRFELEQAWAVRASDVQESLLRHKPHIVHWSGHGSADGKIIVNDDQERPFALPPTALAGTFKLLRGNIRCVVLSACASKPQAEAIAQHIDCVVGMNAAIRDAQAIAFATGLYRGFGYGMSVKEAVLLGCNDVQLKGLSEDDIATLFPRAGVRPEDVRLVRADQAG